MRDVPASGKSTMVPVIGIDLGTSNTCAAVVIDGEVRTIPDERGRVLTPSVVTQNKFGRFIVGHFAKAQQITNPYETIYSVKRLIGQPYQTEEMDRIRRYLSYQVEQDERTGGVLIPLRDRKYTPTDISAQILLKIKDIARAYLG
ncbi:MAG: molecular chaperone DnaK, partial [Deltaproteobacteria bacterium]|nr:molecular chaperone DnaK [Deltaproteobacteria bacterium]